MIHTWSDLWAAIKRWFDTPLKFEKKQTSSLITTEDLEAIKRIGDKAYKPFDYDKFYRDSLPSYYRDPYYKNLKIDDSMWKDVEEDINKNASLSEEKRKEIIAKLRKKYGLDHP